MFPRPWFDHYDPGMPRTLAPYPEKTMLDLLRETAQASPGSPALIFKGRRISYADLDRLSDAFAVALIELGVRKGDVVSLLLPNCPQFLIAEFGAHKAGAIVSPLNPLYTPYELEGCLTENGAEFAVVLSRFYRKLVDIQGKTRLRRMIATNIKEYFPPHLSLLFTLLKEKKDGHRTELQKGDLWLQDALRDNLGKQPPPGLVDPLGTAILMFSGGTTGLPKGAIGTHQAPVISGMQISTWFQDVLKPWTDPIILNLPLFHVYAQCSILPVGLVTRNPLIMIPDPRDLDDLLHTIQKEKAAFLPGVPTLFNAIANHPKVTAGKVDLRSLKLSICGAAALLAETKRRFEQITGGKIVEGYGMTETMMAAVIGPAAGEYKVGSVGMPLPDVDVRIVDSELGERELAFCDVGEIILRAPQIMRGYWQRPAETANTIRDGWIYTGDLGYLDSDGYLFIVDRKKDVIKASGFQVWPREVEEVIAAHPAVLEVGVAGVPDAELGEVVKAWVVVRPGEQLDPEALRTYCKQQLSGYKVPRQIEFRDSLPKSMVGKVLRRELVSGEK